MAASTRDCAVIMAPADQEWCWYGGYAGEQVGQLPAQNKARLTDFSPYIGVDGQLKFAAIMASATPCIRRRARPLHKASGNDNAALDENGGFHHD